MQVKVKKEQEAVNIGRIRRAVPYLQHGNEMVVKLSPDMRNMVQKYLDWRRQNGYGKLTRRWGK